MAFALGAVLSGCGADTADVFVRVRVLQPKGERHRFAVSGYRHSDPWTFPTRGLSASGDGWSEWLNLTGWKWHRRMNRVGGVAEWPSMTITVARPGVRGPVSDIELHVQLADRPDANSVVHDFRERSESATIGFLVPNPLREHAGEFETGSQMAARHLAWARQATGGKPIALAKMGIVTRLWDHYDPGLARQAVATLKMLGFNIIAGVPVPVLREADLRTYSRSWMYRPDPDGIADEWNKAAQRIAAEMATAEGQWSYERSAHWVVSDEIRAMGFENVKPDRRDAWFRDYLRQQGVRAVDLGRPLEQVRLPAAALMAPVFPREADLPTRRLHYHAAKFAHWWSARRLRQSTDLIRGTLPWAKTEALPTSHGFFQAWSPPPIGMSYRLLDLFELGAQRAVDQLSAEDWLGLNHMYGPNYTWTGGQTFAYLNAIMRSAIQQAPDGAPILLRSLITPSDDAYLRLKAYSALGQGAQSVFYWTYGPTHIGTENYWSDLRSQYDGVARVGRALEQAEDVLAAARPVRDPVAILYSVSHDLWHTDDPAAFVEKRLLWHALRHLHVQPDFVREEGVVRGQLHDYKVLYITDWCLSRRASAAIDEWVRAGGVLYLSGGAATRDEFYEPYVPPFASALWPSDAARQLQSQARQALLAGPADEPARITFNERGDLPRLKPMTTVEVRLGQPFQLPVLGARAALRPDVARPFATFADGTPAGANVAHGRGRVVGLGFLPMLAYGRAANFKPITLEERWPPEPRRIAGLPLTMANVTVAAEAGVPVVETSLLAGPGGAALVLVNYSYQPVPNLAVDVKLSQPVRRAVSTEGKSVRMQEIPGGVRLQLPLEWTDIVLLLTR